MSVHEQLRRLDSTQDSAGSAPARPGNALDRPGVGSGSRPPGSNGGKFTRSSLADIRQTSLDRPTLPRWPGMFCLTRPDSPVEPAAMSTADRLFVLFGQDSRKGCANRFWQRSG